MGIIEKNLCSFKLSDGTKYKVELNKGDTIHIHFGNARLDLSKEEFRNYVNILNNAKESLEEEKNAQK